MIAAVQDIRLALQGDAPRVDEEHLIGDELGILGVVRDHQHGDALLAGKAGDLRQHLPPQGRIEGREGLVQQQQRPAPHQGAGQPHPLLLAAGELLRQARQHLPQAHLVSGLLHQPFLGRIQAQAGMQADGDVVEHRQVQEEVVILEQGGDRALGGAQ